MPISQPIAFSPLFLKNNDFFCLALFGNFGGYLGIFDNWLANLDPVIGYHHQHITQIYIIPNIAVEFLYTNLITTRNLILFSACTNYCIHI